jgi:hypothetical protein
MIVDKYGNYVLKFMWQLCGWGRVDIFMTFHMRVFEFFYTELLKMTVVQVGVKTEYKIYGCRFIYRVTDEKPLTLYLAYFLSELNK